MPPTESPLPPEGLATGTPRDSSPGASADSPPRPGRVWALALSGGVLAGLIAWLVGEATHTFFIPAVRPVTVMGITQMIPSYHEQARADRKNATLVFSAFGAILGLTLGAAGGLARRSLPAGARGTAVGALLGVAAGAGASVVLLPIFFHRQEQAAEELSHEVVFPLLIHGGLWGAIGAAGGASFGFGLGGKKRVAVAALGGLIGGILGAVVYEVAGLMVFTEARTTQPLAIAWAPRLLAMLAVSLLTAAMAAMTLNSPTRSKVSAPGAGP